MAINADEKNLAIKVLNSLNERELIELLSTVFAIRAVDFDSRVEDVGVRYCLVKSHFEAGEDDEPYVNFLAIPTSAYLLNPHDEAIETGGCPTCKVTISCADKLASCPVCGTINIECT